MRFFGVGACAAGLFALTAARPSQLVIIVLPYAYEKGRNI
jgi:hypothetical protein